MSKIDYEALEHHPTSERLTQLLCSRVQTNDALFFRVLIAYFFGAVAGSMHAQIKTPEGNKVPVNVFAIDLAPSGFGKDMATTIIEDEVLDQFRSRFLEETFHILAEDNIPKLANARAIRKSSDPDNELARAEKEFNQSGEFVFSFDSGTDAAVKQMRHKLLMANIGAVNLQINEVGSNLLKNSDLLDVFLELYDGKAKTKITKNTSDNVRNEEIKGLTPTNMLLFGTPSRLLNGGKEEEELLSMLETGYGRRCFFGFVKGPSNRSVLTPEEALELAKQSSNDSDLEDLSRHFEQLADIINVHKTLIMPDETSLAMYAYRKDCHKRAKHFREHEEAKRTELEARYFKCLKLAGAYAFVDDSPEITVEHYQAAMKLAEESGEALNSLLNRDKPYVKLAKYIADVRQEVTHADLVDDLPYFPKAANQREDMLTLATAWGYKNNIIIKKSFQDGIAFLRGESLEENDLAEITLSYSDDFVEGYQNETPAFDQLHILAQAPGMHWVNHHLKEGYRKEDNCIPGFNIVVFDVDGGTPIEVAKRLLNDYTYFIYTTKRHDPNGEHRYRIVIPTSHKLELDASDFKEFYNNLLEWLPFEADDATGQRARKWMSHKDHYEYNDGILLDILPFIPKTSKNEERKKVLESQRDLDNLERWILNNSGDGNRNNMLLRYSMVLVDAGFSFEKVQTKVMELNDKMPDKLKQEEIMSTVMVSVSKAIAKRP